MQKALITLGLGFIIWACSNPAQQDTKIDQTDSTVTEITTPSIKKHNFAVTWSWTTTEAEDVREFLPTISTELADLWKKGLVENAYFDTESETDRLDRIPNVAFFMKTASEEEAMSVLDDLTVIQKGFAQYELHPVGILWLKRNTDAIQKRGMTKSFVCIWTTRNKNPVEDLVKAQNDRMMELWNEGAIENVYFDIEGTQKDNAETDFVFFVNANTQDEAEALCQSLPFYTDGIASYKMYDSGFFWMGPYEDQ